MNEKKNWLSDLKQYVLKYIGFFMVDWLNVYENLIRSKRSWNYQCHIHVNCIITMLLNANHYCFALFSYYMSEFYKKRQLISDVVVIKMDFIVEL